VENYLETLNQIADGLMQAQVRGQGSSAFVYAESGARAVDVSRSTEGWWVEFWEGDDAIRERTYSSSDEAVLEAHKWLVPRQG
jgi:hypothetical protein